MAADGTDKHFIARDAFNSVWSPDGDRIAFIRGKSLFTIRPDGGGLRLIYSARAPGVRAPLGRLSWQPL
jgi:Tol biopolymer transport system component